MDTSDLEHPNGIRPTTRLALIRLPRPDDTGWSLRDPYVELVWVEALGVTAVAVARRIDLLMTATPPAHATSLAALATPLGVPPAKVARSLRRLHHHGIVTWREYVGVIGMSGFAPVLTSALIADLSPYGARLHRAMTSTVAPACPRSAGVEIDH